MVRILAAFALPAALLSAGCATPDSGRRVAFQCVDGETFVLVFTQGAARLEAGGAHYRLTQQVAASGISYTGEGHDLRGRGREMNWVDPAGTRRQCMEAPGRGEGGANAPLAGTSWRLVHFRSAAGIFAPPHVEAYTLHFAGDGSAALQLDCNRAAARWHALPSSAAGGTLRFEMGAMTQALCQPGALDDRIAADLERVRNFAIDADRLSLVLEGTSGVYVWERAG